MLTIMLRLTRLSRKENKLAFEGAIEGKQFTFSGVPSETIAQYYIVKLGSVDGEVDLNDSAGEQCHGVAQESGVVSGRPIRVCALGFTKVVAGAAITKGAALQGNGSGLAIAATTADNIMGYAWETAAASGDIITALVVPAGIF